jgi:SpoIIAA-like
MVERIEDMPAGTIGFRAAGKLTPDDYRDVLVPTLREAGEAGEAGEVRMLFVLSDFEELEPRAWLEDAKTGFELGFLKHSAWKRSAIVSDAEWVKKAFRMFAWMTPGEVAVYDLDQEGEARDWVAA